MINDKTNDKTKKKQFQKPAKELKEKIEIF